MPTRVLLVDDSATVRLAVRALLEQHGFEVTAVASGEEAFAICVREPFEVVLSDMNMGALGGVQLCRLLRSTPQTATIPIVMLTATQKRRSRFWARNAGADAYVAKEAMSTELPMVLARVARAAPESMGTGRAPPPLERLSSLLDDLLFRAVLASEVHQLVSRIDDPAAIATALVKLAGEVVDAPYLVVALEGPAAPGSTVLVRGAWPAKAPESALASLGVVHPELASVCLEEDASVGPCDPGSDRAAFVIEIGGEVLGHLRAFGGRARVATGDRDTLALLARESALVVKTAMLAAQARSLARTDPMTGLANRRAVIERLEHDIAVARRRHSSVAVVLCDVDHFKVVNDTHGHAMGDDVLKAVATALRGAVRNVDLVGRWGGEEFLVVLPDASEAGARIAAERTRHAIERLPPFAAGPQKVTASFGAAAWAGDATLDLLVERADRALYRAKARGRNRVEIELPER
ncbi:MAG: diguanylate cyclase [Myxococcota bacterium]|nr:diguanylate cyclase [Myxococcota bacterium]